MTRVARRRASFLAVAVLVGAAGCGYRYTGHDPTTADPTVPTETAPPPDKVSCMILYGTLLPGQEKDVPVMRMDPWPPVQIATIHFPGEVWSPPEAKDLCL